MFATKWKVAKMLLPSTIKLILKGHAKHACTDGGGVGGEESLCMPV